MTLTLHLTPETEAKLSEQAALTGKRPEELALEALHDSLSSESTASSELSSAEWLEKFDAWVNDHKSRNPEFDDSRDSVYPDRC
jgi:predicted transcriptional regulator